MARNLQEEMKTLQDATEAEEGNHMTVEGDGSLKVYKDYRGYMDGETAAYLISRFYGGAWDDRKYMIMFGQSLIDRISQGDKQ